MPQRFSSRRLLAASPFTAKRTCSLQVALMAQSGCTPCISASLYASCAAIWAPFTASAAIPTASYSSAERATIRYWNPTSGQCLATSVFGEHGWATFLPDGRYKYGGNPTALFWHALGLGRYDPGELDEFLPGLRLDDKAPILNASRWSPGFVRSYAS